MNAVDTNVLIYAIDTQAGAKHQQARDFVDRLDPDMTVMLWQVVQEFGGVAARIGRQRKDDQTGRLLQARLIEMFEILVPPVSVFAQAWTLGDRYKLSYYDALILAACADAGVKRLYTEDLQAGQTIEGVELVNPFV